MEKLFTKKQQRQQYERACAAFTKGDYATAEPIFRLVIESAYQHNDMELYVTTIVWLERILVNTSRLEELLPYITLLNPLIDHYGDDHTKYRHELNVIIFNRSYRIGEPIQAYLQLLEKVSQTSYSDLICAVSNNLMYQYVEMHEHREGLKVFEEIRHFYESDDETISSMARYMFWIYSFELFYLHGDYDTCANILTRIAAQNIIVDSFYFMYPICRALLAVQTSTVDAAIQLFDEGIAAADNLLDIKFELNIFIHLLKEKRAYEEVIKYQSLVIDMLDEHYDMKKGNARAKVISKLTRQFYEAQLYIDQLTKVQNRNFYEHLIEKQQQVKNYTVFVLDIDRFKSINDTYGHTVGDEAIKHIAEQLKQWTPKHDISIVRYGGDEFIGLIPYRFAQFEHELYMLHKRLMNSTLHVPEIGDIPFSVSIGVGYTNDQYELIETLFKKADEAIYKAKETRGEIVIA
ncbi:GGDEF domain-containing protein [Kurthia massiliensis]|uniref:GGDEF domain-containing protein n=1 Tax=Kurthia massiliensis TaxID=1033739 RepID=UPI000289079B|nr:GGDEF domain-containing protein [Kurthia massiliensis]